MSNQIDLSKAYAGQIVTFRNGETNTIESIYKTSSGLHITPKSWDKPFGYDYNPDGTRIDHDNNPFDIIALSDPIQVQAARIEGEIKGLEFALGCEPYEREQICNRIDELNVQLKALNNGNN